MKKTIRLTESDLIRIVKQVINEQKDIDHFGSIVSPQMKEAGFRLVDESKAFSLPQCKYYNGNCCKYFCYPNHNNGVNLSLNCEDSGWYYVVYYKGNQMVKEFRFKTGTNEEVKMAAQNAVNYAISLKNKIFPPKQ